MRSDGQHVEPVDAHAAGCQFDGLTFAGQPVGPLAADLDCADRRRNLGDLAAQRGDRLLDLRVGDTVSRNGLQDLALGVLGRRGLPQPDGGGVRLVGSGQQAEDLGGPVDADDQHAGGHRVERASVPDLAGAEDAPAAAHHVMAGHPRRLVHDDKAGVGQRTIAVSARPSRTDQRPDSVSSGGPDDGGRVDQNSRDEPARGAGVVDVERDVRILEPEPATGHRKPRLVRCLLGAEQDSIPMQSARQSPAIRPARRAG